MRARSLLPGLVLALLPALVAAEVYRYIDENGVIRFTDNYIEIPVNQRPEVETITRPDHTDPTVVRPEPNRTEEPPPLRVEGDRSNRETDNRGPEATAASEQSQQQFEALIQAKVDLDKMYRALEAEKETLEKEQTTLKTVESIRAYQNKVNLFNQRLVDYERRRQAFQARAEAYRKTVAE